MKDNCDVLVIGAGPAGMAAATLAGKLGLSTIIVDQQASAGGQIYRAAERSPHPLADALGPDHVRGTELVRDLKDASIRLLLGYTVFDITPTGDVGLVDQKGRSEYILARRIIVATGAMERPFPAPGWTLPGVMTAGAAQILLKEGCLVPRKAVLAGTGPLALLLAAQLSQAGCRLQAFLDTTPRGNYFAALRYLPRALRAHRQLRKGFGFLAEFKRSGTPHITRVEALRIEGEQKARAIAYHQGGREHRIETDHVLLHQGIVPNIQITQALRCRHVWDEMQLCWRPELDRWGRTSQDAIFCAGDGAGIAGAMAAESRGCLAALAVASDLEYLSDKERDTRAEQHFTALSAECSLRPFLDRLYRPRDDNRIPPDDETTVCRCEEVTMGEVRAAIRQGASGPNQLKAFTRAGMGPCQGRMCGLTVCETIAAERAVPVAQVGYYRLRTPIRPLTLGAFARLPPRSEPAFGSNASSTKTSAG